MHRSYWMTWTSIRWCSDGTSCLTPNPWSVDLHPLLCLVDPRQHLSNLLELKRTIYPKERTYQSWLPPSLLNETHIDRGWCADFSGFRRKHSRANTRSNWSLPSRVAPKSLLSLLYRCTEMSLDVMIKKITITYFPVNLEIEVVMVSFTSTFLISQVTRAGIDRSTLLVHMYMSV